MLSHIPRCSREEWNAVFEATEPFVAVHAEKTSHVSCGVAMIDVEVSPAGVCLGRWLSAYRAEPFLFREQRIVVGVVDAVSSEQAIGTTVICSLVLLARRIVAACFLLLYDALRVACSPFRSVHLAAFLAPHMNVLRVREGRSKLGQAAFRTVPFLSFAPATVILFLYACFADTAQAIGVDAARPEGRERFADQTLGAGFGFHALTLSSLTAKPRCAVNEDCNGVLTEDCDGRAYPGVTRTGPPG